MKKVISFCLWAQPNGEQEGRRPMTSYILGALLNADIAKKEWPDWICRYYIDESTIPFPIIDELKSRDNVEVILSSSNEGYFSTIWRFLSFSDSDVDYVICRDIDSRLCLRDKAAVDEWVESGMCFHIMRDHCQHTEPIGAGMFGIRGNVINNISNIIDEYRELAIKKEIYNWFGVDQEFLRYIIYPMTKEKSLVHDEWTTNQPIFAGEDRKPFPIPREKGDGWWKKSLPKWHSATFGQKTCSDSECKLGCPDSWCIKTPCPCCKAIHDNDYIGKIAEIKNEELEKYSHLLGVKL
jgi:hypothetical protein